MKKLIQLNEFQLAFIYTLSGLLVIQWSMSLIAPFNALRSIEELNSLMILSDSKLQNSHFIFKTLAILVDYGISYQSIAFVVVPYVNIESFIVVLITLTTLFHPTHVLQRVGHWFVWLLTGYGVILLTSIGMITAAFISNSPQRVLMLINSSGHVAVFGGIGLSLVVLVWISQVIMSVVRQK
jgi:hypothetical protein